MLAGANPAMAANGTVTGTANSLALALGQAHGARFITPALALIAAEVTAGRLDSDAADEQKAAIVDAWNDLQAPWLQDMADAIISHITTHADIELTISATSGGAGLQRVPDPADPGEPTDAPEFDVTMPCTIA